LYHSVLPGETLVQISRDYRIPLAFIIGANPSINPDVIYVGQRIEIPNLPDPSSIPYRIDVSINKRTLSVYRNNVLQKHIQLLLVECFFKRLLGILLL